jgi:hypothetical protein
MNERSFVKRDAMSAGERCCARAAFKPVRTSRSCISKCNPSGVLQQGGRVQRWPIGRFSGRFARISPGIFTVWNLPLNRVMKLWRKGEESPGRETVSLRHDFVIGPQRYSDLFGRPAQLYHCVRCKWSFMVGASKVVVLDEHQRPIVGAESLKRFNSFGQGPCPALEAFVSAASTTVQASCVAPRNGHGGRLAPFLIPAPAARPRPGLRLLGRMRANFVR